MIYKYFAWKEKDYWHGHKLLPESTISFLANTINAEYPRFTSIQNYDSAGNIVSCPIYFDLDGSPDQVLQQTRELVQWLEHNLGVCPQIYFSGGKGFHVIVPYLIEHPLCHLIVGNVAKQLNNWPAVDTKVYTPRRYWRMKESPGSAKGYFKTEISNQTLFQCSYDQIKELATTKRYDRWYPDMSHLNQEEIDCWIEDGIEALPTIRTFSDLTTQAQELDIDMTPCLISLFNTMPIKGTTNQTIFLLTRFFKSCQLTADQALDLFMTMDHWKECESTRGVSKVIYSTYSNNRAPSLGCKSGEDGKLMRSFCDSYCHFNEDFEVTFLDGKESYGN